MNHPVLSTHGQFPALRSSRPYFFRVISNCIDQPFRRAYSNVTFRFDGQVYLGLSPSSPKGPVCTSHIARLAVFFLHNQTSSHTPTPTPTTTTPTQPHTHKPHNTTHHHNHKTPHNTNGSFCVFLPYAIQNRGQKPPTLSIPLPGSHLQIPLSRLALIVPSLPLRPPDITTP